MVDDLTAIKQLEQELGMTLYKTLGEGTNDARPDFYSYTANSKDEVIAVCLREVSFGLDFFPQSLLKFKNLKLLDLYDNEIEELPDQISELINLEILILFQNRLRKLPQGIGKLKNLWLLDLNSNRIKTLPKEIGELSELKNLYLHFNELSELPEEIFNLNNLSVIDLDGNNIQNQDEVVKKLLSKKNRNSSAKSAIKELPESDDEIFNTVGSSFVFSFVDQGDVQQQWNDLNDTTGSGFAFDLFSCYALYEWLAKQEVIKVKSSQSKQFLAKRHFARSFHTSSNFLQNLVLFEEIYVNFYGDYTEMSNLEDIKKYGIFKQYPNPHIKGLYQIYQILKPIVFDRFYNTFINNYDLVSFDELWKTKNVGFQFDNYQSLFSWLYDDLAKYACNIECNYLRLFSHWKDEYIGFLNVLVDYSETSLLYLGSLVAGKISSTSVMLPANGAKGAKNAALSANLHKHDALALYQVATSNVLGHSIHINSFDNVLRLRDDNRLNDLRSLLMPYVNAVQMSDEQIIKDLEGEILKAKKSLKFLEFRENPAYLFGIKPFTYIPVIGTIISILNDCADVVDHFKEKKHGWIYFGIQ